MELNKLNWTEGPAY